MQVLIRNLYPIPQETEQNDQSDQKLHPPFIPQGINVSHTPSSKEDPTQSAPPYSGAGALQSLWRRCFPLPHFAEHVSHMPQADHCPSIAQGTLATHSAVSFQPPIQSRPPFCGIGLLHCLVLVFKPNPQDASQNDHCDHIDQWPSTAHTIPASHFTISKPSPTQKFPPNCGSGLLQSLLRFISPYPQVTLQTLTSYQAPQFPCIGHGILESQSRFSTNGP